MAISKIKSDSVDSIAATKLTGTVDNARITLDAAEIPNLDAAKITTGSIANARVPAGAVTQHVVATDTSKIENDIAILALHQAVNENKSAYSLGNAWIEQFENSTYITGLTTCARVADGEYVAAYYSISGAFVSDSDTMLLIQSNTTNGSTTFVDSSSNGHSITLVGSMTHSTAEKKIGSSSMAFNGSCGMSLATGQIAFPASNWTIEFWYLRPATAAYGARIVGHWPGGNNSQFFLRPQSKDDGGGVGFAYAGWGGTSSVYTPPSGTGATSTEYMATGAWVHCALVQEGSRLRFFFDGINRGDFPLNSSCNGGNPTASPADQWEIGYMGYTSNTEFLVNGTYLDELRFSTTARYSGTTTFTPQADNIATNAAGSFTSTTITPQDGAAKTSVGLVLLYKNQAGTNALNSDIICKVSANNGTNYTTCVLAAKGTFSTGILIAVAPAVTVTSGTQLKYKIEFANQTASKQARIHGVAMTY
jgi:hypothetical protein